MFNRSGCGVRAEHTCLQLPIPPRWVHPWGAIDTTDMLTPVKHPVQLFDISRGIFPTAIGPMGCYQAAQSSNRPPTASPTQPYMNTACIDVCGRF